MAPAPVNEVSNMHAPAQPTHPQPAPQKEALHAGLNPASNLAVANYGYNTANKAHPG